MAQRFCYFGIYKPRWPRDTVLLSGLRSRGAEIIECVDDTPSVRKFFGLIRKHRAIKNSYEYLIVGYLSNLVVPLARLLSNKKIIFNAGNSMYEGSVLDRGKNSFLDKEKYLWFVDWLAFACSHTIIVESEAQKEFLVRPFRVRKNKMVVIPMGADDRVFHPDAGVAKEKDFTVVFRGWFIPGTGVEYVLETAKRLKNEAAFLIIGRGFMLDNVRAFIAKESLSNVELVTEFLSDDELRRRLLSAHVMLGQFSGHDRLERTIQNKTFEALALGMPFITQSSKSTQEILQDGVNCLFTRAKDSGDIAEKILRIKKDPDLAQRIGDSARALYEKSFTPARVAELFTSRVL